MNLFIFFVLPFATILLSIVLQKILRSPLLVAITFFAIYLIVAFTVFSTNLAEALIAVIVYTIIAYITACIVMIICRLKKKFCTNQNVNDSDNDSNSNCMNNDNNNCSFNLNRYECSYEDNENELESTSMTNSIRNKPMALGNSIVNRNNIQRRYSRRW